MAGGRAGDRLSPWPRALSPVTGGDWARGGAASDLKVVVLGQDAPGEQRSCAPVKVQWGLECRPGTHLTRACIPQCLPGRPLLSPFISGRVSRTFHHHLGRAEEERLSRHPLLGADELTVGELE